MAQMAPDFGADSTLSPPVTYRRIRITDMAEISRLYRLISAFVSQPSLAQSVTEIVIDDEGWPGRGGMCYFLHEIDEAVEGSQPAEPVRDDAHIAIERHVQRLGLGVELTEAMLKSFQWQKRSLVGARSGPVRESGDRIREFASVAITVLISLCKNISTLYMGNIDWDSVLHHYLLKSNYGVLPQPGLQKLEHLESTRGIYEDATMYGTTEFLDYFYYFHRLPMIHSIVMEGVEENRADRQLLIPGTGNMKKIHISHADISGSLFGTIISIPAALEDVKLSIGGLYNGERELPNAVASTIGKALLRSRTTLKILDLDLGVSRAHEEDMQEYDGDTTGLEKKAFGEDYLRIDRETSKSSLEGEKPDEREYRLTIGSLHDFEALTHLSINLKALLGSDEIIERPDWVTQKHPKPPSRLIDALPPNLEYLCIYGYVKGGNEDIDGHFEELMANKAQRLPRLKEIKGVDQAIASMEGLYGYQPEEEELWIRPERDLDWEKT